MIYGVGRGCEHLVEHHQDDLFFFVEGAGIMREAKAEQNLLTPVHVFVMR